MPMPLMQYGAMRWVAITTKCREDPVKRSRQHKTIKVAEGGVKRARENPFLTPSSAVFALY